ncbi:MAG: ATP-binding protein [Vicinamibacterales bacterium]
MPLSIRTKQVAGVTALVGLVTILLSLWYLSSLASILIRASQQQAEQLSKQIGQQIFTWVNEGHDPGTLEEDSGLRSILQSSLSAKNVLYAAVVDRRNVILAHYDPAMVGTTLDTTPAMTLTDLAEADPLTQGLAIYNSSELIYELREPLFLGPAPAGAAGGQTEFGSIRIGVSTLLIRTDLYNRLLPAATTAVVALVLATVVALLLARAVVQPIHVIRSGLARLGRGELDVDLPLDSELADLGDSFKAISARLAADRSQLAGQRATLESVGEHLEDAVALFSPEGLLLFANPAMTAQIGQTTGTVTEIWPDGHPYRTAVEDALRGHETDSPRTVEVPGAGERLVLTDIVHDANDQGLGVLLVARNLAYLSEVESTLSYSRKLAALSRLSAGIAHEVKNPLNATMIHLELLKMKVSEMPDAMEHVTVIGAQMRRLDEVVQGFLRFTRPEDLKLRPLRLAEIFDNVMPVVQAEAGKNSVQVAVDVPSDLGVSGDAVMLEQAFLNLALNACQAMPDGGQLRIVAEPRPGRQLEIRFEDTGVGIAPADLARIFDLYFTTKSHGSGIGLSLVFRTVQLHDGEIEVRSAPGRGTTFRVTLRQPSEASARRLLPAS